MPGALLGIADQLREPAMERSPPARVELRLDARSQQGVAEANTLVIELQDRRSLCCAKPPAHCRGVGCHRLDDRDRGLAEQRNRLEHLANLLRQRRQPRRDETGERRRNRQPLTRAGAFTRLLERAPELERIERIPARRLVKLDKRRSRKRDTEPLAQQTMSRADTQRAEPQSPQQLVRKRAIEPERSCFFAAAAACDENRGRRRRKPPKRERQHRGRRRIEPLHVINRNQQRPAAALTEKLEHRERDRPHFRRRPLDLLQQQSRRKRTTLRHRQPPQPLRQHRAQEIGEGSKREGRLGARRTAREDGETLLPRRHHRCVEERRLPDPCLTVQHKPLGRGLPSREKVRQHRNLDLTADKKAALPRTPLIARRTVARNSDACKIRMVAQKGRSKH